MVNQRIMWIRLIWILAECLTNLPPSLWDKDKMIMELSACVTKLLSLRCVT